MKNRNLICVLIALAMVLCCALTGCGETPAATPDKVNDLKFNFETGEFSFSDVEAEEYYVRLFLANPSEEDADMPVAAQRVRDVANKTSYSGTLDTADLEPGVLYNAIVYTYVEDAEGNLVAVTSDPVPGTYKTTYPTPTNVGGVSCTILDNTITVTLSGAFFSGHYGKCDPGFQINLYKDGVLVETKTLNADDIEVVVTTTTNCCGQEETSVEGKAEATFDVADATANYTVTLKVISSDATAYYDSAEGEGYAVTEYVEPVATEPAEGGNTGEGGSEGSEGGEVESTEPVEGGESEGGESEGGEPAATEPAEGESEGGESEGGEPAASEPAEGESEGGESEGGESEGGEPEATEAPTEAPAEGESEGGESEGGESEGGESEGGEG